MDCRNITKGDQIIVRFGSRGEQLAVVAAVTPDGNLRAHKWLAASKRWTARVTVYPVDVKALASPMQAKSFRPDYPLCPIAPKWRP